MSIAFLLITDIVSHSHLVTRGRDSLEDNDFQRRRRRGREVQGQGLNRGCECIKTIKGLSRLDMSSLMTLLPTHGCAPKWALSYPEGGTLMAHVLSSSLGTGPGPPIS